MESLRWKSKAEEETESAARALADVIADDGLVIGLNGPLGAGKTLFVRGLAQGLGLDAAQVASPTFAIANEYWLTAAGARASRCLVHVDLYRIQREEELRSAGFFDYLRSGAVVAVEWANRFRIALPADRIDLEFSRRAAEGEENSRQIVACARGDRVCELLMGWRRRLEARGVVCEVREEKE